MKRVLFRIMKTGAITCLAGIGMIVIAGPLASPAAAQTVSTIVTGINTNGDVAVDGAGNVYVSCEGSDTVVRKITPDSTISIFATGMSQSRGMTFDATGETLYVARATFAGPIRKVKPDGTATTLANGFSGPTGIAFGPSGNLYVADQTSVTKVLPDGTKIPVSNDAVFNRPNGIAVDENENIYVASAHDGNIYKVVESESTTVTWLAHVDGLVQAWACGLMDYHDGSLYITNGDNKTHRIPVATGEVFDYAGTGAWGYVDGPADSAKFMAPNGIWVTADGRVYVTEYGVQRIRVITPLAATGVGGGAGSEAPRARVELGNARPNPFNPLTTIAYTLGAPGNVQLTVHDVAGRRVRSLVHESRAPGAYEATWNGTNDAGAGVASGVYFFRLESEGVSEVRRTTLVR